MAYGLYDAFFDTAGTPWTLGQLSQATLTGNITPLKSRFSGGVVTQAMFVQSGAPRLTLVTEDLHTLLTNVSISAGYGLTGTAKIPQQERLDSGTFDSTSNQYSIDDKLFAFINSITADQGGMAQANVEVVPLSSDGLTTPVTVETGQSLSSQVFTYNFALGPAKYGSTAIPGLTRVSINPGMEILYRVYAGGIYPILAFISRVDPTITWTFEGTDVQSTLALFASIGSTCTQYLRRRTEGGTYVANGTGSHIAFTLSGGLTITDNADASNLEAGTFNVTAHGKTLATSLTATIS